MPTSVLLSSCLLLNPLENSPPKVLWYALHQSHTNERHYTLQSVWFKDDLQPFPSAVRNGNLPRDKLRLHLQNSKDIKGFKLCIGGVAVRSTKIGFYLMWNYHNRVRGLWVIMIPESMAAFMICSWACTHRMFSDQLCLPATDVAWHKHRRCLCTHRYPACSWTGADNWFFGVSSSRINFPCAATPNSKQKKQKKSRLCDYFCWWKRNYFNFV